MELALVPKKAKDPKKKKSAYTEYSNEYPQGRQMLENLDWDNVFDDWSNIGKWTDNEPAPDAFSKTGGWYPGKYLSNKEYYWAYTDPNKPANKLKRQAGALETVPAPVYDIDKSFTKKQRQIGPVYNPVTEVINKVKSYLPSYAAIKSKWNLINKYVPKKAHVPRDPPVQLQAPQLDIDIHPLGNNMAYPLTAQQIVDQKKAYWQARPLIRAARQEAREQWKADIANPTSAVYKDRLAKMVRYGGSRKRYRRRKYRRGRRRYGRRRWYGRGTYFASPGTNFGGRLGGYLGATAGEYLGNTVGRAIGLGDYDVRSNVLSGRLPEVTNTAGNGGTIIRYQEYLGDVITSENANTFKINTYLLNPANSKTFPWLSQIAANYEQYEFQGVIFYFRSTSANALNSTNTALGTVMMATQYDMIDEPFRNKMEMLNYEFSNSSVPSQDQPHMIECDPHQTTISLMYTESGEAAPANTDPRLYFLGKMSIATTGFQGTNVNIGELHVTYQVKLLKPKLHDALGKDVDVYITSTSNDTAFDNANPLGIGPPTVIASNAGMYNNYQTIFFNNNGKEKQYFVDVYWNGGTGVTTLYPTVTMINCFGIGGVVTSPGGTVTSQLRMNYQRYIRTYEGQFSASLTFVGDGTLPTGTGRSVRITVIEVPLF